MSVRGYLIVAVSVYLIVSLIRHEKAARRYEDEKQRYEDSLEAFHREDRDAQLARKSAMDAVAEALLPGSMATYRAALAEAAVTATDNYRRELELYPQRVARWQVQSEDQWSGGTPAGAPVLAYPPTIPRLAPAQVQRSDYVDERAITAALAQQQDAGTIVLPGLPAVPDDAGLRGYREKRRRASRAVVVSAVLLVLLFMVPVTGLPR